MLKAPGRQFPFAILFADPNRARLLSDFTDQRNTDAVYALRQSRNVFGIDSNEQLKILATVQSERQRIKRTSTAQLHDVFVQRQ